MTFVQADNLTKRYGPIVALSDCSLTVERGEILGLLGPNGAGKTTLLRLLLGYLKPTAGHATIDGLDCYRDSVAVHERTSYLPGEARLPRNWDGRETLSFFTRLRRDSSFDRARRLAERLDLDLSRRVNQMSTGMRQKLALAATLAPEAALVVLDEPTSSLDPTVRREVMTIVRETRAAGRTVLFSSHVLSEVEETCDRVVILRAGELVDSVRVSDVLRQHRIRAKLSGPLGAPPTELASQLDVSVDGSLATILASGDLAPLLGWLAQQPLAELQVEPLGLRAAYERHHPSTHS